MIYLNELLEKFQSKESENKGLILKEDTRSVIQSLNVNPLSDEATNKLMETVNTELSAAEDDKFLPYTNLFMIVSIL